VDSDCAFPEAVNPLRIMQATAILRAIERVEIFKRTPIGDWNPSHN
jgi:hypothetical protein